MRRLPPALALLLLSLLSGCASTTTDSALEDAGLPAATATGLVSEERFTTDVAFVVWTEVCGEAGTAVVPVFVGDAGDGPKSVHMVDGETRLVLDLTWAPANAVSERLHFRLAKQGEPGLSVQGVSPLQWELSGDDLEQLGAFPKLYVYPACDLAASAGSNQGQTVDVVASHFV